MLDNAMKMRRVCAHTVDVERVCAHRGAKRRGVIVAVDGDSVVEGTASRL